MQSAPMTHTGTPIGCWHRARNSTARRHFTSASQVLTVAATKFLYFPTVSSAFDFAARASRAHAARGAGHVLRTPTSTISDDHSQTPLRAQLPRFFISLSLPRRAHRPCACPPRPGGSGPRSHRSVAPRARTIAADRQVTGHPASIIRWRASPCAAGASPLGGSAARGSCVPARAESAKIAEGKTRPRACACLPLVLRGHRVRARERSMAPGERSRQC